VVEIPEIERRRLGLDLERSWIVLTEFNAFFWPGADLRPIPNKDPSTVIYGMLSRQLFARVLEQVKGRLRARLVSRVSRKWKAALDRAPPGAHPLAARPCASGDARSGAA
jgi:hypothetical protein